METRKILTVALLAVNASGFAQVYQFQDPGFDNAIVGEMTSSYNEWYSFENASGSGLALNVGKSLAPKPSFQEDGHSGKCIYIYSKNTFSANANGNLTTGKIYMGSTTPESEKNYNYTNVSGTDGKLLFAGRPDAIGFYAKFTSGGSPNGRGHFILHDEYEYKDPETSDSTSHRIGKAAVLVTACKDWTYFENKFTYDKEQSTKQYLLASFTTNPTPGGSAKDTLWIDDINFIYYHALTSLSYGDTAIPNFAEGTTYYELSDVVYDANKTFTYEKKGVGATVEISEYDKTTRTVTITVKGNDYNSDNTSVTTYTVKFAEPKNYTGKLASLTVNEESITLNEDEPYYVVTGTYTENSIVAVAEDGEEATVTTTYDANTRIATIKVNAGDKSSTSYVKFIQEATGYDSKLLIGMNNEYLASPAQSVGLSEKDPQNKIELQLRDFMFWGMNLGDIFIEDVECTTNADGSTTLSRKITDGSFKIFGKLAEEINSDITAVKLNGTLSDDLLSAEMEITWSDMPITVTVYPVSTPYVDASSLSSAGTNVAAIREGLTNSTALVYVGESETVSSDDDHNVVIGEQCADLTLNDANEFYAPKGFTATTTNYGREFKTTDDYISSFVLPITTKASNVNGTVYKLNTVKNDVLFFESLSESENVEANVPYLIKATSATLLNDNSKLPVTATPETMEVSNGLYHHIGSYSVRQVTSDNATTYYGYQNGDFVKATSGTLNPFRTMIVADEANSQAAQLLVINLDGEKVGIVSASEENLPTCVIVYNMNGQIVRQNVHPTQALRNLPAGVYIVNGHKVVK